MAFLDETGLAHLWDKITKKFGNYVAKEDGKGLSEANYTAVEKQTLAAMAEAAPEHLGNTAIHVPSCTTSDNGKFLRVSNGSAAWTTIDNAEGVTF